MKMRKMRAKKHFCLDQLESRSLLSGTGGSSLVSSGLLDPRFGKGGSSTFSINGPSTDTAANVAIVHQGDGKIVVAGTASGPTVQSAFAVARQNADGSPDNSFGDEGTTFTSFGLGTIAAAKDVAVQPDGKILVAGLVEGNINNTFAEDFGVARYNKDGSLDSSFGNGGKVLIDFGSGNFSEGSSIVLTPAGKILVTGTTSADGGDFAMAQLNSNGSLDAKFGSGGEVITSFGPSVFASDVNAKVGAAVLPSGQIVLAGLVFNFNHGTELDFGLASYNSNGSPKQGFGSGGEVITTFNDADVSSVAGIAVEPGASTVVVAGSLQSASEFQSSFALARFNVGTGSLDASFGNGGQVITQTASGTFSTATGITIQPSDGAIVVSGTLNGSDSNFNSTEDLTLARYKAKDGSLDTSFGSGGQVITSFGAGTLTSGSGVTIQSDGKIVAGATVGGSVIGGFGLVRYNSNGSLDTHFNHSGEATINVTMPAGLVAAGEAIQPDGKIVMIGTAGLPDATGTVISQIVVTRFNSDGSLDHGFGNGGTALINFGLGTSQASAVTIEPNGEILVVGNASGLINNQFVQDFGVALLNSNGSLDKRFGHGGETVIDFGSSTSVTVSGVAIEKDGTIVVAGSSTGFDANFNFVQDFALAGLNPNGSVDSAFGTHGQVLTSFGSNTPATASGIAITPDGKIVVAGTATDPNTFLNDFALASYDKNGRPDNSFGNQGQVLTAFAPNTSAKLKSVAIQSDGKLVVAGSITDPTTFDDDFAVARYTRTGKLDTSFGNAGEVVTSFGTNTTADGASVAIQSNGEIVVAGTVEEFNNVTSEGFGLVRYLSNGSVDPNFGTNGLVFTTFGPNTFASAVDVVIGNDGEIYVAGTLSGDTISDFVLAAYGGPDDKHHH